jgi:hypothetical protein
MEGAQGSKIHDEQYVVRFGIIFLRMYAKRAVLKSFRKREIRARIKLDETPPFTWDRYGCTQNAVLVLYQSHVKRGRPTEFSSSYLWAGPPCRICIEKKYALEQSLAHSWCLRKERECRCAHSISAETHTVPVIEYRSARKGGKWRPVYRYIFVSLSVFNLLTTQFFRSQI